MRHKICGLFLINVNSSTPSWDFIPAIAIMTAFFPHFNDDYVKALFGTLAVFLITFMFAMLIRFRHNIFRNTSLDKMFVILSMTTIALIALGAFDRNIGILASIFSMFLMTTQSVTFLLRSRCLKRKTDGPEVFRQMQQEQISLKEIKV